MSAIDARLLHPIPDSEFREYPGGVEIDYKASIPGLELVEAGGVNSAGKSCDEHVFSGEVWYRNTFRSLLFEGEFLHVLEDAGYGATNSPSVGDVATYLTDWAGNGRLSPVHYGKFVSGKLVESKFGENGAVFRHDPNYVPKLYGEFILYLHK